MGRGLDNGVYPESCLNVPTERIASLRRQIGGQPTPRTGNESRAGNSWPVFLLIVSLLVPLIMYVGPLRLSAYRICLAAMAVPAILMLLSGQAGRIRFPDVTVVLIWLWLSLSLVVHHPLGMIIEPIGVSFLETVVAYLLGRGFIRTPDDYRAMILLMFRLVLLMLPFALIEAFFGRNLILEIANTVGVAHDDVYKEPRWGLDRVQGPFEHPILYGVFFGVLVGPVYKVLGYGKPYVMRVGQAVLTGFTASFTLSSGPLVALTSQAMLLGWNGMFGRLRQHWLILTLLVASMFLLVEIVANRSSPEIFISYFAFNADTAWNRIHIWEYGSQNVWNNPVFGLGLNDWERAWYMSGSMDMFWLVPAVRGGVLPGLLFQALMLWTVISLARRKGLGPRASSYREGFLISLVGYYLVGWTVHFWNATYVQFLFMLGAGMWMLDWKETDEFPDNGDGKDEPRELRARHGSSLPFRRDLPRMGERNP